MTMQSAPRLSVLDRLLANNGFGSLGKALRDSVINTFGSWEETPQDVFTVFEYRHVHRHDWDKLKSAVIQRWRQFSAKIFPDNGTEATCSDLDDEEAEEQRPGWETEPELRLRTYPYMIFPLAVHKLLWDYLIIGLVAFNVLELPKTIAFGSEACDEYATAAGDEAPELDEATQALCRGRSGGFEIFMDVMFWADILLTFRTGVIDNKQIIHMQPQFAAMHYVRTWLLVDVLSSFPFDTLVYATATQSTSATFLLARLFKLPRLLRTARILKNFHRLAKTTSFQIIYMLFCTFTLTHWAACGYYFLARWQMKYLGANEFTGGLTWAQVPVSAFEPSEGYVRADFTTKYTAALYWATTTMSTTGYGDILPMTNWERSYALFVMLVGVVMTALVFGVLAQIITEAFDHLPTGTQYQTEVKNKLQAFTADMKLDPDLSRRLQEALQLQFHLHGGVSLAQILSTAEVSRNIREDVFMYAHGHTLQYLEAEVVLEGEAVFAENDVPTHLLFLQSGTVKLHLGLQAPKDGSSTPSLRVVPPAALGECSAMESKPHEYTATADTNCEVLSVLQPDMLWLLQTFKQDSLLITRTVTARHKDIMQTLSRNESQAHGYDQEEKRPDSSPDVRWHREGVLQAKSAKGIVWEDRRQELGLSAGGLRGAAGAGTGSKRMRLSRGMSRRESAPVDEEVALLLDTLEELSEAQSVICSKVVKLAAAFS